MQWLAQIVRHALIHWGYFALAAGLLAEYAGLPIPGETTLMFASFLSHKSHHLALWLVILVGIAAAVAGDNFGYLAGRWLGRRLLRWLTQKLNMGEDIAAASDLIRRHGGATVFWARYIFGLRTIAGPVAGALDMEWNKFLFYNALGAATWVTTMAFIGFAFADEFSSLLTYFEKCSWALSLAIFILGYVLWQRKKEHLRERTRNRS